MWTTFIGLSEIFWIFVSKIQTRSWALNSEVIQEDTGCHEEHGVNSGTNLTVYNAGGVSVSSAPCW